MTISRRDFTKVISAGSLLLSVGGLTGCISGNALSVYLQTAKDAVDSLFTLLRLSDTNPLVSDVNAAFAAAIVGANKYGSDNVAGDPVLVSLLDAVDTALQTFLAQADIPSGEVTLILVAIELVISTIEGWISKSSSALKTKLGVTATSAPLKRSKKQFINDWNTIVKANGRPGLQLHLSFWENF